MVVIGVVVSQADDASVLIGEQLLTNGNWSENVDVDHPDTGLCSYYAYDGVELRFFEDLHLYLEDVEESFNSPDIIVFVSRHAGDTGPLLTTHHTGNFGPAEYGGASAELARAAPNALAHVYRSLTDFAPSEYSVGIECTHHGPSSLQTPSLFVELGSDEAAWRDQQAAKSLARAVLSLRDVAPDNDRTIVGFGGGHYAPRFKRIIRETDWTVGHIGADWCLDATNNLNFSIISQAFQNSGTQYGLIVGNRPELSRAIDELGYIEVSETWLRETTGVPLNLVSLLEQRITTIDDGLRFGSAAIEPALDFLVKEPSPNLLSDLHAIDPTEFRSILDQYTIAYETKENGNRVAGRLVVHSEHEYELFITDIIPILESRFDQVSWADDELVVSETRFDAQKARELGITEGPLYGRLASGEIVTIDGKQIMPDQVITERVRKYTL